MRFREIFEGYQIEEAKSDARIHHLEDMVIWHGSEGAKSTADTLRGIIKNPQSVSIKWDGSPAVIFGRDENGEFILTDKSGFGAKGYDGKVKSGEALAQMLLSRGKEAPDDSRKEFAAKMASVFPIFEAATPADFRGYMFGDLLYYTTPHVEDGKYILKPNLVVYKIDASSDIGKRISQSSAGVVIHNKIDLDGSKTMADASQLNEGNLLVMRPVYVQHPPKLDDSTIRDIEAATNNYGNAIDKLFDESELVSKKIKDLQNILYTYVNAKVKTSELSNLANDFIKWLDDTPKISNVKKVRIKEHLQENQKGFEGMFTLFTLIMTAKNDVIGQFDNQDADVEAYTAGNRGGEGYVVGTGDAKLVNRSGFSLANLTKNK